MSRSLRIGILKDKPRNHKNSTWYWRIVRRVSKQALQQSKDIPNPKEIVNDYDYCDWHWKKHFNKTERK